NAVLIASGGFTGMSVTTAVVLGGDDTLAQHDRASSLRRGRSDWSFSPRLPRSTGAPQKKQQCGRLMACASRDMSWCTAPTSPGAARGRQALAMTACAAMH